MKKILLMLVCMFALFSTAGIAQGAELKEIPEDAVIEIIDESNFEDFFEIVEMGKTIEGKEFSFSGNKEFNPTTMLPYTMYGLEIGSPSGMAEAKMTVTGYWGIKNQKDIPWNKMGPENYGAFYDEENNILYYFKDLYISFIVPDGTIYATRATVPEGFYLGPTDVTITSMQLKAKKYPHVTVTYCGMLIEFDQNPVIEEGRTLVPLRAIFEKLGAEIAWDDATKTVTATKGDTVITLTIDNANATKNGEVIALDVPAKIINDRTMVPVRFIADSFGVNVEWNADLRQVVLTN